MHLALFLFLSTCLTKWEHVWIHMNFRIAFIFMKNAIDILIRILLRLYINLNSMDILSRLVFQSVNTGVFSFILSTLISFINYVLFSV